MPCTAVGTSDGAAAPVDHLLNGPTLLTPAAEVPSIDEAGARVLDAIEARLRTGRPQGRTNGLHNKNKRWSAS